MVVSTKIDTEAASKATEVTKLIAELQAKAKDLSLPNNMESFEIEKLLSMVKDRVARDQVSSV